MTRYKLAAIVAAIVLPLPPAIGAWWLLSAPRRDACPRNALVKVLEQRGCVNHGVKLGAAPAQDWTRLKPCTNEVVTVHLDARPPQEAWKCPGMSGYTWIDAEEVKP